MLSERKSGMTDLRDFPTWEMSAALDAWRLHRPELRSIWEKVEDLIREIDRLRSERPDQQPAEHQPEQAPEE